jgi:hypothetical protein
MGERREPGDPPAIPESSFGCPQATVVGSNGAGYRWDPREGPHDLERYSVPPPAPMWVGRGREAGLGLSGGGLL